VFCCAFVVCFPTYLLCCIFGAEFFNMHIYLFVCYGYVQLYKGKKKVFFIFLFSWNQPGLIFIYYFFLKEKKPKIHFLNSLHIQFIYFCKIFLHI
jgi:hypothetical protein